MQPRVVAGATGYVGRALVGKLIGEGEPVRAMARSPERARDLERSGAEVVGGDVLEPATLEAALEGAGVAYYLVHSMGRGGDSEFASRDREGLETSPAPRPAPAS